MEWSIDQFLNHKGRLESPHKDDLPDIKIREIYMLIKKDKEGKMNHKPNFMMKYPDKKGE